MSDYFRDSDSVELRVGDEIEFSLLNSSTKPTAENIRKLKSGTILSMVSDADYTSLLDGSDHNCS